MNAELILREFPNATKTWLRYQVGYETKRPVQMPVLDMDKRIVGWKSSPTEVCPVFNLVGWGETQEKAEAMAKKAMKKA